MIYKQERYGKLVDEKTTPTNKECMTIAHALRNIDSFDDAYEILFNENSIFDINGQRMSRKYINRRLLNKFADLIEPEAVQKQTSNISKDGTPIKEMVSEWLKANGYKGLYNESGCGCGLDDLMPCECVSEMCAAAYEFRCDNCIHRNECDKADGYRMYSVDENWCDEFEPKD